MLEQLPQARLERLVLGGDAVEPLRALAGREVERLVSAGKLDRDPAAIRAFDAQYRAEHPYPFAAVDVVLDHIEHVIRLAGIAHVGLGSDFDGVGDTLPRGLEDVAQYPKITLALLRHGLAESDVEKIWGGNTLRVLRAAEEFAAAGDRAKTP